MAVRLHSSEGTKALIISIIIWYAVTRRETRRNLCLLTASSQWMTLKVKTEWYRKKNYNMSQLHHKFVWFLNFPVSNIKLSRERILRLTSVNFTCCHKRLEQYRMIYCSNSSYQLTFSIINFQYCFFFRFIISSSSRLEYDFFELFGPIFLFDFESILCEECYHFAEWYSDRIIIIMLLCVAMIIISRHPRIILPYVI